MKNNQEAGFRLLFQKYSMPLRTEAYFRLKDLQLAEDVVQEFFLALWEKRHRINIDRSVKYFFYQSVRNRCNDALDKQEVYSRKTREYAASGEEYLHPPLPEYLPEHGGVRIEDTMVVTDEGCTVLTNATKELAVL